MERYWVAPLVNIFDSTDWSATSGGSAGASIPGFSDTAIFDRYSGNCLVDATTAVSSLNLNSDFSNSVLYANPIYTKNLNLCGGHLTATSSASVHVSGDTSCLSGFGSFSSWNNANIIIDGSGVQYISTGGIFPSLTVDKTTANPVLLVSDSRQPAFYMIGDLTVNRGTFDTHGHNCFISGERSVAPVPITGTPAFISALYEDMWYSPNGIDWTKNTDYETWNLSTLGGNGSWYGCASSGIFWVFGGYVDGVISMIYSTDGINFNICNADNIFNYVNGIATNGTIWVAGGYSDSSNALAYSYDGINWTGLGLNDVLGEVYDVQWNGSQFLAGGVGSTYYAMYSSDGINWTPSGDNADISNITTSVWDGTRWVVNTSYMTEDMAFSTDASSWTIYTPIGLAIRYPLSIAYSSGAMSPKYILVGRSYTGGLNSIAYSTDASNWTNLGNSLETELNKIVWNGTRFVAVSSNAAVNSVVYSDDGTAWNGLGTSILPYGAWALGYGNIIL